MTVTYKTVEQLFHDIKLNKNKKDIINNQNKKKDNLIQESLKIQQNIENNNNELIFNKGNQNINELLTIWLEIKNSFLRMCGEHTFESWFNNLDFINMKNNCIYLTVPTNFIKEWLIVNYYDKILKFWQEYISNIIRIEIAVSDKKHLSDTKKEEIQESKYHYAEKQPNFYKKEKIDQKNTQLEKLEEKNIENKKEENKPYNESINLKVILDSKYTFDNFIVGKPNNFAFAAAKKVSELSYPASESNPLFLYSNVGLGKTHLMHAIAWNTKKNFKDKKVLYMSAETFMYRYITSLKERNLLSFKNHLRSLDILMIDDLQFISGKESTQEEFFHTFNALIDQKRQLIISADRSPNDLNGVEERIKSRLGWGLVADINPTTFELRMGILQSKLEQTNTVIPNKITEFIAKNITSSVRELEGALKKVIAHASLVGQEISLDSTKEILSDLMKPRDKTTSIDEIIIQTANYFNIKISEIKSIKRSQKISLPRQIAMYLAKKLTKNSLPSIGKSFGRDHATVIHSIRKIDYSIKTDSQLNKAVTVIIEKLNNT